MAFPHAQGLLPTEVAFLCEMELVTIVPRQRLERLDLLGGPTNPLIPPQRTTLPLWLALLLKRQRRINILPPPWLEPQSLQYILELETKHFSDSFSPPPSLPEEVDLRFSGGTGGARGTGQVNARQTDYDGRPFYTSPPFVQNCTASASSSALPYHWFEMAEMLLDAASDDVVDPDTVRGLLRDLREVRLSKMRKGVEVLTGEGEGVRLDGVGAMELSESRAFIIGVMDGLRKIGASREQSRREREEEERENGRYAGARGDYDDEDDENMT